MRYPTIAAGLCLLLVFMLGITPVRAVAYPDQGDCSSINLSNLNPSSSRACPGISTSMLSIAFQSRSTECVYIDNVSATSYFVPLGTPGEWDAFKAFRPSGTSIVYGCPQQTVTDVCGRTASLPEGRNGSRASSGGAVYSCVVLNSCGSWVAASIPPCYTPTTGATAETCSASPEICAAYERNLGRLPDMQGAEFWQNQYDSMIAQGYTPAQASAQLDASIGAGAEATLHRVTGQSAIEVGYMLTGYTPETSPNCNGVNCTTAINHPGATTTAPDTIASAYATALGRAPDQSGFAFWNAQVQSGAMTVEQAVHAISCSSEAVAKGTAGPGC